MHFPSVSPLKLLCSLVLAAGIALTQTSQAAAHAEAALLVEADSGKVIEAENATFPWHPASLTKVMTAYVTLSAVKSGRLTLDTLLAVSPNAAGQVPSKMGFAPGTRVTVDNALKMMMVKSANDMAVVLAEGVGGSVEGFSAMMNETAQRLGMTQTNYVNPNGLPDDRQVTSARDLAILARAFIRDLPDYEYYVHIPAIRYGRRVTPNFNKLIGRYPGADGMKTGFICASGFNLMATATQNGRRLIAVVLGAPSSKMRSIKAIKLLERGFSGGNLTWLKPALGTVDHLAPIAAAPPNLRDEICGPHRKRPASDNPEDDIASVVTNNPALNFFADGLKPPVLRPEDMLAAAPAPVEPVIVYTGPTRTGAELIAAAEADAAAQEAAAASARKARATKRHGGKRVTVTIDTRKPAAGDAKSDAKSDAKADAKSKSAAKPAAHASAKPAEKPAAHKPAAAAKPAATAKPAPKDKPKHAAGETKPKN